MRIIGGKYKSRSFSLPKNFKATPTTDFARENLFNILNNTLDWESTTALDLFSGTGSIALELISRGCPRVISIEKDHNHYNFISSVKNKLSADNLYTLKADAFRYLKSSHEKFDFIFADPPYNMQDINKIPELIFNREFLNSDGLFILEHDKTHNFSEHAHFVKLKTYGSVNFSFFQ